MVFKSTDDLFAFLQSKVTDSLQNEVADDTTEKLIDHAKSDILDIYTPKIYQRRSSGGIDDPSNVVSEMIDNNTLSVRNETLPSPSIFSDANDDKSDLTRLASGISDGLYNPFPVADGLWNAPKPFVANAQEEIKQEKSHVSSLKAGLKRNGIESK